VFMAPPLWSLIEQCRTAAAPGRSLAARRSFPQPHEN